MKRNNARDWRFRYSTLSIDFEVESMDKSRRIVECGRKKWRIDWEVCDSDFSQWKSGRPCPIRTSVAVPLTSSLREVFSFLRPHRSAFRRRLFVIKKISQFVDILPLTTNEVEDFALLIREFTSEEKRRCRKCNTIHFIILIWDGFRLNA